MGTHWGIGENPGGVNGADKGGIIVGPALRTLCLVGVLSSIKVGRFSVDRRTLWDLSGEKDPMLSSFLFWPSF